MLFFSSNMDAETQFFRTLIELQYGLPVEKKLRSLALNVSWAQGWPENDQSFWNAEAFMWQRKIERPVRTLIAHELDFLHGGRNLDVGCGAFSYLPSIGIDFAEKMLSNNEQCTEKICADLNTLLPLRSESFDSVTAVFVLNYIEEYILLIAEVLRMLVPGGVFVMVLYGGNINVWQRQKELNTFSAQEWVFILERAGFKVRWEEKETIWFFRCRK